MYEMPYGYALEIILEITYTRYNYNLLQFQLVEHYDDAKPET